MKNKFIRITGAAVAAFGVFMAFGWTLFDRAVRCRKRREPAGKRIFQISHMKINHPRNRYEREYEAGRKWCEKQSMRDCYIRSEDGLLLHALYFPAREPKRIILLAHGYRASNFGDFAGIARFLHENNCSLLFIDQRCCGKSEGKHITFGAKEQSDIQRWAYYLAGRNHDKLPIYLYGESMGASSVLMASGRKLPREVKGLIADCGFHSMRNQIQDMAAGWFHLRWIGLLLFRLNLFCILCAGFRMKQADTTEALMKNERPVLFFHGSEDTYVSPRNSAWNYSVCKAPKELVLVPGARHICSVYTAPRLYRKKLLNFFDKYDA